MRLTGIHIKDFLSFNDFAWEGPSERFNVIVGPNGAGKTNFFRALQAVVDGLDHERRRRWRNAARGGAADHAFTIALDVTFNTPWERDLLTLFVRTSLRILGSSMVPQYQPRYSAVLREWITPDSLSWFFQGRLVVQHEGRGRWAISYESLPNKPSFRLGLDGTAANILHCREGDPPPSARTWEEFFPDRAKSGLTDFLDGSTMDVPAFDLQRHLFSPTHGLELAIQGGTLSTLPVQDQDLDRYWRGRVQDGTHRNALDIFGLILRRAFVFTENVRQVPEEMIEHRRLGQPVQSLSDGQHLALYLFQQKNGDQVARQRFQAIVGLFQHLTDQRCDVALMSEPGSTDAAGRYLLELRTLTTFGEVPMRFSGAGRAEALLLSALIAGEGGRVVLLDEPAQNLHPTVQTLLLSELQQPAHEENQFFIITHAPTLVPPEAIDTVSRFHAPSGGTVRAALDAGSLDPAQGAALKKELRATLDARALLFNRAVILLEGDTEQGALPLWYRAHHGHHAESDDIALHNVGSDKNFGLYVRFLRDLCVPWAILCDGGIIGDSAVPDRPRCAIAGQLCDAGVSNVPPGLDELAFDDRRRALESLGVFTFANSAAKNADGFEALPLVQAHLAEAKVAVGKSKPRIGRYIAENHDCPPEVAAALDRIAAFLRDRDVVIARREIDGDRG